MYDIFLAKNTGLSKKNLYKWIYEDQPLDYILQSGVDYIKMTGNIRYNDTYLVVDKKYDEVMDVDFIFLSKGKKDTFFFVNDVEDLGGRSRLNIELDVVTTFIRSDWDKIKSVKIIREHLREPNFTNEPLEVQEFEDFETNLLPHYYTKDMETIVPVLITIQTTSKDKEKSQPSLMPFALEFYMTFLKFNRALREWEEIGFFGNRDSSISELVNVSDLIEISKNDKTVDISILPFSYEDIEIIEKGGKKGVLFKYLSESNGDFEKKLYDVDVKRHLIKINKSQNFETILQPLRTPKIPENIDPKVLLSDQFNDMYLMFLNEKMELDKSYFKNDKFRFRSYMGYGPTPSFFIEPIDYYINHNRTVEGPYSIPIVTDEFRNYLNNEKYSRNTALFGGIASSIINLGVGVATGGLGLSAGVGRATGIVQSVLNDKAKKADLARKGVETSQTTNIDILLMTNHHLPRLVFRQPTLEEQKRISNYFKLYGYSSNRVGKLRFNERENWHYIQAQDLVLDKSIPVNYRKEIEEIFNNGIRLWDIKTDMLDFSVENKVLEVDPKFFQGTSEKNVKYTAWMNVHNISKIRITPISRSTRDTPVNFLEFSGDSKPLYIEGLTPFVSNQEFKIGGVEAFGENVNYNLESVRVHRDKSRDKGYIEIDVSEFETFSFKYMTTNDMYKFVENIKVEFELEVE